jgi:hypothetical protein
MAKRAAQGRRAGEEEAEDEETVTTPAAAEGNPQALEDRRLLRSRYLAVKSQINGTAVSYPPSRACLGGFRELFFCAPFCGSLCGC